MQALMERLRKFRDEREWRQFHTPKNLALAVVIEAAELAEIFQWADERMELSESEKTRASDEVADVLVYLLYFCDLAKIDLMKVTEEKIENNARRFPVDKSKGIAKPPRTGG